MSVTVNLVLAAASILLTLAAVEAGLRATRALRPPVTVADLEARRRDVRGRDARLGDLMMASADANLVYELIPGLTTRFGGHEVRTNSAGFRDDEFVLPKPPRTTRIAVVGDSGSFGWRVAREDSYPEALETVLGRFAPEWRVEVMNFGVPGYNTVMEREVLVKKVLPYDPDILVLQFDGNDIDLPNFMKTPDSPWALRRSLLLDLLAPRLGWRRRPALLGLAPVPGILGPSGVRYLFDPRRIPPEYAGMVGEENCKAAIRDIARIAASRNVGLLFLLNPNLVEGYEIQEDFAPRVAAARDAGFAIVDPTRAIRDFVTVHGLSSLDLWVDARDAHAMPARHSLLAREVARSLLDRRMLDAPIAPARRDEVLAALRARADSQIASIRESVFGGPLTKAGEPRPPR